MTQDTLPTPQDVLDYFVGEAAHSADAADKMMDLWFKKSDATDAEIRERFQPLLETLSAGPLAQDWAIRGPKERLAAIIVLDQFSRNMFRNSPRSFAQDALALKLAIDGVAAGEDAELSEVGRMFMYLPFEHSEDIRHQADAIRLFSKLRDEAREPFKALTESTLSYAHQHRDVIAKYGRFPHRNAVVARANTPEEEAYLAEPGAGF